MADTSRGAAHAEAASGVEPSDLDALQARLGWTFSDIGFLAQALAHRSWCAEAGGQPSNERLEFLGDAVLGLAVAEHCYRHYPKLAEGSLAKVRAAVVNTAVLAEVGLGLGLGDVVLLGRGESASGGRRKPSIVANTTEAVIGAVYLDGGWAPASSLVLRLLDSRISDAAAGPGSEDFKTRLQEVAARRVHQLPRYEVVGTGPDHERRYRARVFIEGAEVGEGRGRSKKDAEQAAARMAWLTFATPVVVEDAAGATDPARTHTAAPDTYLVPADADAIQADADAIQADAETATDISSAATGGEQDDA